MAVLSDEGGDDDEEQQPAERHRDHQAAVAGVHASSLEASSSARCIAGTPARSASWTRHDMPVGEHHGARRRRPGPPAAARARRWRPRPRSAPAPRRSCRPARSSHPPGSPTRRPGASSAASASQPSTDAWWQCGWATTSVPLRSGGVQPGRSDSSSASVACRRRPRPRAGPRRARRRRSAARPGTTAPARPPACRGDVRVQRRDGARDDPAGRVELAGGDPGEPAAGGSSITRTLQAGRLEQPDRGQPGAGREVVGEGVGPEPHVRAAPSGRSPGCRGAATSTRTRQRRAGGPPRRSPWPAGRPARARASAFSERRHRSRQPGPARQPAQRVVRARPALARRTPGAAPPTCTSPCRRRWGSRGAQPLQDRQRSSASCTAGSASPSTSVPSSASCSTRARPRVESFSSRVAVYDGHITPPAPVLSARHLPTPVQRCTAVPSEPPSWTSRSAVRTGAPAARAEVGVQRRGVDEHPGVEQVVGVADRLDRARTAAATPRRTSAAAAPTAPGRRRARRTASRRSRAAPARPR